MRSIFASLAITVALSLGACGQKAPSVGAEGKECKDLFAKFDGWCKDAKDPVKGFCDSNKAAIETLKKVPVEASCTAVAGAYKTVKDMAAVPAGSMPASAPAASTPAPAGDAPAPDSSPAK